MAACPIGNGTNPSLFDTFSRMCRTSLCISTHGYRDHYGGTRYSHETYPGVQVYMSAAEYDLADREAVGPRGRHIRAGGPMSNHLPGRLDGELEHLRETPDLPNPLLISTPATPKLLGNAI